MKNLICKTCGNAIAGESAEEVLEKTKDHNSKEHPQVHQEMMANGEEAMNEEIKKNIN